MRDIPAEHSLKQIKIWFLRDLRLNKIKWFGYEQNIKIIMSKCK
jgi:hypothetical protein